MKKQVNILDIDLDFFLNKRFTSYGRPTGRVEDENYLPWEESSVIAFLENNCNLNTINKPIGKYFIHHDEAFYFLRELQEVHDFEFTFSIDHVDAHADLGMGDSSYSYISSCLLFKSIRKRSYPDKINGHEGLSAGNFLSFAIACRWVKKLKYITCTQWSNDLPWFIFQNYDIASDSIQLKKLSQEMVQTIIHSKNMLEKARSTPPISLEPEVPFKKINYSDFKSHQSYDYIFLTQSPDYTPSASDVLIPIIQSYMDMDSALP